MANVNELLSSRNFVNHFREKQINENIPFLLRAFFGVKKQYEEELGIIKGARKSPVKLSASAKDANTLPLQRGSFEITKKEMPYFKNDMTLGEKDARKLFDALNSRNDERIKTVVSQIYDDAAYLLQSAEVTVDVMLSQLFTTGLISINENGVKKSYDYGIDESQKKTAAWKDFANSEPLSDIEKWIDERKSKSGYKIEEMVLNSYTFGLIRKSQSIKDSLVEGKNSKKIPSKMQVKQLFLNELQLNVYICDDIYDNDGVTVKHIPDGIVVLFDGNDTGDVVYTYTPAEIAKMLGEDIEFTIVNEGICFTSETKKSIVQSTIKVDESVLPSFYKADSLIIASVDSAS